MRHAPLATFALCLALLGAASPARAAADLASVTFTVSVVRVENAVEGVTLSLEVVGDRITRASITPPGGTLIEIPAGGDGFLLEDEFSSEAELTTAFPDGSYVLTLNGTMEYPLELARAPVTSPAISAPLPAEVLVPGPVTVAFTRCSICDQDLDSTTGVLLDGDGAELETSPIAPEDENWSPATSLDEEASFTAGVVHTVVRGDQLVGPISDDFDLAGIFSSADSVSFFTGAAVPTGELCVVVDDESLDTGSCFVVEHEPEESGALLDPSGTFALPIGGIDMEYTSELLPSGAIVGTALADLDGNGSLESSTPLSGKVTGVAGKVRRKLGFAFETLSPEAKLKVKIVESGFVTEGSLAGKQSAKGTVQGVRIDSSAPSTLPLGEEPLGWRLDFELAGKRVEVASITLSDGREFALTGRFVFDFLTGLAKLDLGSADDAAGVSVRIEDLLIDDSVDPPEITDGVVIYKILGQRGRFPRAR